MSATGFLHRRDEFAAIIERALADARALGASAASAEVSESNGLTLTARQGALETLESSRDESCVVTVYDGLKSGHASSANLSADAVSAAVRAAWDIARFTAEDAAAQLPDEEDWAAPEMRLDGAESLDLLHPWLPSSEEALALALRIENAARCVSKQIVNSEGASVSAWQSHFLLGAQRGDAPPFLGGFASSNHSLSVSLIAANKDGMQRDGWYSAERRFADLADPERLGDYAARRALSHLSARKIGSRTCPVLFEAPLACGLLGGLVRALSGGALYRQSSFLLNSLGTQVLPAHLDLHEDPFLPRGVASAPFDEEGVRVQPRKVVESGVVQGYFLSSYSARKLGMRSSGNAGGAHNLTLASRETLPGDDLPAMLRRLHRGFFVTELLGQGVNLVTGDYSRGARGFWVEEGVIAHPVEEVTLAGNLRDMLKGIVALGAQTHQQGGRRCGPMLIESLRLGGV